MKRLWNTYRTSVTVRSLTLLILLTTVILVCVEAVSMTSINAMRRQTMENYQDSLETYFAYWDERLNTINQSLIWLADMDYGDSSYWSVCYSENTLEYETSKTLLEGIIQENGVSCETILLGMDGTWSASAAAVWSADDLERDFPWGAGRYPFFG
ncbi:MAG: hypothetical protein Q4F41_11765 [Eubacteriales bacterium]|nr:hypothetical protein [Eubacteriales bacterium]